MRRAAIGVAAGVVVAPAAVTGVYAYWQAQQELQGGLVASGQLAITATWVGGTPSWAALYPGQSTPDAFIRVTPTSSGDNLAWKISVTGTVAADFEQYTTLEAWVGACGGTNPIPASGYGSFTSDTESVDICVRYTLDALAKEAPKLQGRELGALLTVHADQATP